MNNKRISEWPWIDFATKGRTRVLENVRILIYKENPQIFELLDYDNDTIFNEPLLFAYFYANKKGATLEQLLLGYIDKDKRPESVSALVDGKGIIYLPEIGWLKTELQNDAVTIDNKNGSSIVILNSNNVIVPFTFKPIQKTNYTSFELIIHQHPLLIPHYFDANNKLVGVEVEFIAAKQKENLTKAFVLIRDTTPEFYYLLEQSILKVVIFQDASVKRNSFATVSVHGCAFFNAFQPEYDEVFFVEDIAHQCGHVIFNNITHSNKNEFFKINPETIVKEAGIMGAIVNLLEKRTLYVAFHALFTYYSISLCLEACLLKADLTPMQKHEALGRLAFCFRKYENDINLLGKKDKDGNSIYFSNLGMQLYLPIEELFLRIKAEWKSKFKTINLLNQPYNFSNKNFHKSNPLK